MDIEDKRRRAEEANVEFLTFLADNNMPIDGVQKEILRRSGYVVQLPDYMKDDPEYKTDINSGFKTLDRSPLHLDTYLEMCQSKFGVIDRVIDKSEWMPPNATYFDKEFVSFISSTHIKFEEIRPYKEFYLYMRQAQRWLDEKSTFEEQPDKSSKIYFARKEISRIKINSLYFANKYALLKEGAQDGGDRKYKAHLVHAFLLFLFDQGRSMYIGKGRQIACTSTISIAFVAKMISRVNLFLKFIAQDESTTNEIFDDKIKYTFGEMPDWLKPKVANDRGNLLKLSFQPSSTKGSRNTKSTSVRVVPPSPTAINGGSPDIVGVDEAAFIDVFEAMVKEARPTMFQERIINGISQLVHRRQVVAWSTGGRTEKGKGVFEGALRTISQKWYDGNFSEGIVPIILDWTTRPGISREFYLRERDAYALGRMEFHEGMDLEQRMVQFYQHYPSSIDDMFTKVRNTLVPASLIRQMEDRMRAMPVDLRPSMGRFKPIYDESEKMPVGSYFRAKVIGAEWVPAGDDDISAPVWLFLHPEKNKEWRYWQGTDPISSGSGQSNMASAIWDRHLKTISCIVNYRTNDPYEVFEQVALMGKYYANPGQDFCLELIENNISSNYEQFKGTPALAGLNSFVLQTELPEYLQTNSRAEVGLSNKSSTRGEIIARMKHVLSGPFAKNIVFPEVWLQASKFVLHQLRGGGERWDSEDVNRYQTDVLFAVSFAYICALSFPHRLPKDIENDNKEKQLTYELRFDHSTMTNKRVPIYR